jgi:3-isopropylmalate dehydrogenase
LELIAPSASSVSRGRNSTNARLLGIVPGEGIGPEVLAAALHVLDAVESARPMNIVRRTGGEIGLAANGHNDGALTDDTAEFFRQLFDDGGAILCGPGGGRFVYDLRRRFDLFCKLAPLKPIGPLSRTTPLKSESLKDLDILVVRDNAGGIYQGHWNTRHDAQLGCRVAEQHFSYSERQVEQIVTVGARLARTRRGRIDVVIKDGGIPTISDLWRGVSQRVAAAEGVACSFCNVDFAAYDLLSRPQRFDVLITPNLVGDILADLGALFLGSRGLSFSANFSSCGRAVYQTGHGAAHDLAGSDRANPVGQIQTMAMMLRESYGLADAAAMVERAIEDVYKAGYRTDDLPEPGCRRVGTRQMGELIAQAVLDAARVPVSA